MSDVVSESGGLSVMRVRHPNGFVIGKQDRPPYWSFYNGGGTWAGSGTVYPTQNEAEAVRDTLARGMKKRLKTIS
jgi:hypothetical protein